MEVAQQRYVPDAMTHAQRYFQQAIDWLKIGVMSLSLKKESVAGSECVICD